MTGTSAADTLWITEFFAWMQDRKIVANAHNENTDLYSVEKTKISALLDNSATHAILDKYLPQTSQSRNAELVRAQTLVDIQDTPLN